MDEFSLRFLTEKKAKEYIADLGGNWHPIKLRGKKFWQLARDVRRNKISPITKQRNNISLGPVDI